MLLERSGLSLDIETVRLNAMPGQERRSEMINMKIQGFSAWPCRKTLDGSRRKLRALYKNKRLVPGVNPVGLWSSPRTDQRRLWRKARTRLKSAELFRENIHAQPLFSLQSRSQRQSPAHPPERESCRYSVNRPCGQGTPRH